MVNCPALNLWSELKKLQGKTLFTLHQKKSFKIREVSSSKVVLRTSIGSDRSVPMKELERAWIHLEQRKKLTREEIRGLGYSNFNPAYVAALLANMPGVTYSTKPIILCLES